MLGSLQARCGPNRPSAGEWNNIYIAAELTDRAIGHIFQFDWYNYSLLNYVTVYQHKYMHNIPIETRFGPQGLIARITLICLIMLFLFRSENRHLRCPPANVAQIFGASVAQVPPDFSLLLSRNVIWVWVKVGYQKIRPGPNSSQFCALEECHPNCWYSTKKYQIIE